MIMGLEQAITPDAALVVDPTRMPDLQLADPPVELLTVMPIAPSPLVMAKTPAELVADAPKKTSVAVPVVTPTVIQVPKSVIMPEPYVAPQRLRKNDRN
jgi:hypothetical protein